MARPLLGYSLSGGRAWCKIGGLGVMPIGNSAETLSSSDRVRITRRFVSVQQSVDIPVRSSPESFRGSRFRTAVRRGFATQFVRIHPAVAGLRTGMPTGMSALRADHVDRKSTRL